MRFIATGGLWNIYAVAGTHVVSLAIDMPSALHKPAEGAPFLLGFGIARRLYDDDSAWKLVEGYRFFLSKVPKPRKGATYSTFEHPWQSFIYNDFLANPDTTFEYAFHPIYGRDASQLEIREPMRIVVTTEPITDPRESGHDVYFNRGVASSQGYSTKFGKGRIDSKKATEKRKALEWLSCGLDKAMVRFIHDTPAGDRLLCCFYEFEWKPAIDELLAAIERGVDVRLILDWKDNSEPAKKATAKKPAKAAKPASPRDATARSLEKASIPMDRVTKRKARPRAIAHNKFMVRVGAEAGPQSVWTGSTNLTRGAVSAQTNVAHVVRDPEVASRFAGYWDLLSEDPGARDGDDRAAVTSRNRDLRDRVEKLSPVPGDLNEVPAGTSVVFSPRGSSAVLGAYARLIDTADVSGCMTLPFGQDPVFRVVLGDNTADDGPLVMILLNKEAKPTKQDPVLLSWKNNVFSAHGGLLDNPVSDWLDEAYAGRGGLGLTSWVDYIHSKIILIDPLSSDPLVVSGSANFSVASIQENDENSLIVRGDARVADIYFTEFNRLFEHYLFRAVDDTVPDPKASHTAADDRARHNLVAGDTDTTDTADKRLADSDDDAGVDAGLFENQSWARRFLSFRLRGKRLTTYRTMELAQPSAEPKGPGYDAR